LAQDKAHECVSEDAAVPHGSSRIERENLKGSEENKIYGQLRPPETTEQETGETAFDREEQAAHMSSVPARLQQVAQAVA
jgi:hypothetical protein